METPPLTGRTTSAHIRQLMANIETTTAEVFARLQEDRPIRLTERIALWRRLAGVVGDCEAIRIWLDMGAPR